MAKSVSNREDGKQKDKAMQGMEAGGRGMEAGGSPAETRTMGALHGDLAWLASLQVTLAAALWRDPERAERAGPAPGEAPALAGAWSAWQRAGVRHSPSHLYLLSEM